MKNICKRNGRPVEKVDPFVDNFKMTKEEQRGQIIDLFRTPAIRYNRRGFLLCMYHW